VLAFSSPRPAIATHHSGRSGGLIGGIGVLALAGLFDGVDPSDRYALRWQHVLFWDLWFSIV
jgi:hypothetical protein